MLPNELKNCALVAAVSAELDGFHATAEALRQLASACSAEAIELAVASGNKVPKRENPAASASIFKHQFNY